MNTKQIFFFVIQIFEIKYFLVWDVCEGKVIDMIS